MVTNWRVYLTHLQTRNLVCTNRSTRIFFQDGGLNMVAVGMVKNANMAVSHLESANLNFEFFTSTSNKTSLEISIL